MKKPRTLATFNEVANINANINTNTNVNGKDVIDEILNEPKQKKMLGIYFDSEVSEALDRISTKRGDKSAIVNEAVKRLLIEKGLL